MYSTSAVILESDLAFVQIKSVQPSGPASPYLRIYPKERPTYVHEIACTRLFIEALLVVAQRQKHSG